MKKDPRVYLLQILERVERIESYTEGGKPAFFRSFLYTRCRHSKF